MAISDQLTAINNEKVALKAAITAKGVNMTGVAFTNYHTKVGEITGGAASSTGWQPHPDWWDIKTILANDSQPGYTARYVFLLTDMNDTIALPGTGTALVGGTAWKTSDGQFYTSATTHTWNRALDRACALGYKSRYVIVYNSSSNISVNHRAISSLYVYFGNCNIASIIFGSSPSPQNLIVQSIETSAQTTCSTSAFSDYAFSECLSLESISIPIGAVGYGFSCFSNCYNLRIISIPSSVTTLGGISYLYCLKSISIPASVSSVPASWLNGCTGINSITIPSSVTSIASNAFSGCTSVVSVNLGTNFDAAFTISSSSVLSPSSMIAMFNNLKDNTGFTAKTLTLGATNLAKLTQAEKNIAINKNWNLA